MIAAAENPSILFCIYFLNGNMDGILDVLIEADLTKRMKEGEGSGR